MKGIDVSYHNGVIDWKKVKQSVDFAIIRAGYGKSQMDKQYINNICGAHTAGLKIGIYWFIYAANMDEAVLNAKMCEKCIEGYRLTEIKYNFAAVTRVTPHRRSRAGKYSRSSG